MKQVWNKFLIRYLTLFLKNIALLTQATKVSKQQPLDISCQLFSLNTTDDLGLKFKNTIFDQIRIFLGNKF
jgi:hypothetical protein